jgi:hypothetical protein
MVWCMIRQALNPDPSCRAVLAWLQAARTHAGLPALSSDTGAYCKARARLPETLLPALARRAADELGRAAAPADFWCGRRVLAADGSTFSMPDTQRNQGKYPQPSSQKPGCGFPLAGFVAVICLATGALVKAALGQHTVHDLALFYYVRSCFTAGDVFLGDRGFCSYAEMALFRVDGVDSVLRLHQSRRADFRRGRALGAGDHVVNWHRPASCPKGLRPEDYGRLPAGLPVRELRYRVEAKGFRTREVVLATTLLDAEAYPAAALAELYFRRWGVEVDFRHLKTTMGMDVLRGKSPEVVEREFWAHVLAYNLTRRLMWEAGRAAGESALGLSLKGAMQHVLSRWPLFWRFRTKKRTRELLELLATEWLPERPGRVEPRVRKRRPKNYPLMTKPRHILKRKLIA